MAAASATSVNKDMETSMERLSTGKRINSAKDDAAGVAIASRLSSEIRGTNQAIRNAQDGQALINTAEGAHKEIENILQRMRELSVQSANDTNDSTDRTNLQAEFTALTTEIDRIAGATTWAGQNLLTGSGGNNGNGAFNLQVGGNTGNVDKITVSINAMTTAALGASDTTVDAEDAVGAVLTADFSDADLTAVDADVTVTIGGKALTVDAADATSLANIVTSLNANDDNTDFTFSTSGTDLVATANTAGASVSTFTVTGGGTEDLENVVAVAAVLTADFDGIDLTNVSDDLTVTVDGIALTVAAADATSLDDIVTSLNANTDNTDFTFSASGTDLVATANTAGASVSTFTVTGGGTVSASSAATAATTAQTVVIDIGIADGDTATLTISVTDEVDVVITSAALNADDGAAAVATALQTAFNAGSFADYTLTDDGSSLLTLSRADGTNFTAAFTTTGTGTITTADETSTDGVEAVIGIDNVSVAETTAGADAGVETTAGAAAVTAAGAFDISDRDAALLAIDLMDAAINTVNTQRAELGAVSNRLDHTVNNLTNITIQLEGGKGRIEDADFAAESTNLAKSQILAQASTAMLAQANASKQSVLSLLQG